MIVEFSAIGLEFEAIVDYYPGCEARMFCHPDNRTPAEPPEIEFKSLECDGKDASFLLDSQFADLLESAAMISIQKSGDDYYG